MSGTVSASHPSPSLTSSTPAAMIDLTKTDEDSEGDEAALQSYYLQDHNVFRPGSSCRPSRYQRRDQPCRKRARRESSHPSSTILTADRDKPRRLIEFSISTWNVLFEPIHVHVRMREIARQVKAIPCMWFAGFQEVTDESEIVLRQEMEAAGYDCILQLRQQQLWMYSSVSTDDSDEESSCCSEASCRSAMEEPGDLTLNVSSSLAYKPRFGCMLCIRQLSKDPKLLCSGFRPFDTSNHGRGFCYAICRLPSGVEEILVATTHMESIGRSRDRSDTGSAQRSAQLIEFVAFAEEVMKERVNLHWAILTGDMNWSETGRDAVDTPMGYVLNANACGLLWKDTWIDTKPTDPGATCYTYDGLRNPMRNNQWRSRLDRTLVFSRNAKADRELVCLGTNAENLLGTQTLLGNSSNCCLTFIKPGGNESAVAPSDHFGFVSQLRFDFSLPDIENETPCYVSHH